MLGKVVERQFRNPSFGPAAIFFLLPFILQLSLTLIFSGSVDVASFLLRAFVPALLNLFISSAILYVLLLAFKGKAARGKFGSVLASMPVYNLVYFIGLLIMAIVFFLGVPSLFTRRGMPSDEVLGAVYAIASSPQLIHWAVLAVGLLIGIGLVASYLYIVAKVARLTKETGTFSDSVLAVIFGVLSLVSFLLISGFFVSL